jgi:tetratricopeptide (TPR) repeat protein
MADKLFRESLSLARRIGSVAGEGGALRGLGATANFLRNDLVEAEALTRESLAVETRAGRIPGMMDSLWALGGLAWSQGEYARALEFQTAVMAHRQALGWEIRDVQFIKGFTYLQLGEHESVLSIFREVRAACRISDYPDDYRSWLLVLASSSAQQGDVARAARLFGAVASEWGDEVYSPAARFTPMFEDYRESARGRLGEPAWSNLWEEGRALSLEQAVTYALEVSGGTRFTPAQSHPQRDLGDRSRL